MLAALIGLGALSDHVGRRPTIIAGQALLLLSVAIFIHPADVTWLFVARLLQGVGAGLVTGAAGAALVELHPQRSAQKASLVNGTVTAGGIALGAAVSGALAQYLPEPDVTPYVVLGLIMLSSTVWYVVQVPETVARGSSAGRFRIQRPQIPAQIRPQFAIAATCVTASWSVAGLFLGLGGTLTHSLAPHAGRLAAGITLLLVQGIGGVTQLLWNLSRRADDMVLAARVGTLCLILGLGVTCAGFLTHGAVVYFIGAVVTGVGFGLSFMAGLRVVMRAAPPQRRNEVTAAFFTVAYLAISVPAVLAGLALTHFGASATFVVFSIIVSLLALGVLTATKRRREYFTG